MQTWNVMFFVNSALLGVGLAMDAFSVSMTNGLNEPNMRHRRMSAIAGVYAFFQYAMPMIGWICVHTIVNVFSNFQKFIPWIALVLLLYIGGKMIIEAIIESRKAKKALAAGQNPEQNKDSEIKKLTHGVLLLQGIATSIDALSVGFTIAEYDLLMANVASLIIAIVTFGICMVGLKIGKKAGEKLANKGDIVGGIILIAIGIEIFVKGIFFS